jgi:hypothetical protein
MHGIQQLSTIDERDILSQRFSKRCRKSVYVDY